MTILEDDLRARIAANVARHRARVGLSAEAAASRVGLPVQRWQAIEGADTSVTLGELGRLAVALSVDPAVLVAAPGSRRGVVVLRWGRRPRRSR